jgi:hypothetical protein
VELESAWTKGAPPVGTSASGGSLSTSKLLRRGLGWAGGFTTSIAPKVSPLLRTASQGLQGTPLRRSPFEAHPIFWSHSFVRRIKQETGFVLVRSSPYFVAQIRAGLLQRKPPRSDCQLLRREPPLCGCAENQAAGPGGGSGVGRRAGTPRNDCLPTDRNEGFFVPNK